MCTLFTVIPTPYSIHIQILLLLIIYSDYFIIIIVVKMFNFITIGLNAESHFSNSFSCYLKQTSN